MKLSGIVDYVQQENNKIEYIPFADSKLSNYLPGIIKNYYYIVTANSGVGKTQFTKHAFVINSLLSKKDCKIFYFALEESKEEFYTSLLSYFLFYLHNIEVSPLQLEGVSQLPIGEDVVTKIKETEAFLKTLDHKIEVIDHLFTPTDIYKYILQYTKNNGTIYYEKDKIINETEGNIHSYKQNSDKQIIVITDHVSLLEPEFNVSMNKYMSVKETIDYWSFHVCRRVLTKIFKYTVVNVQQQSAAGEDVQHKKLSMLEPTMSNLGESKTTQRDE